MQLKHLEWNLTTSKYYIEREGERGRHTLIYTWTCVCICHYSKYIIICSVIIINIIAFRVNLLCLFLSGI